MSDERPMDPSERSRPVFAAFPLLGGALTALGVSRNPAFTGVGAVFVVIAVELVAAVCDSGARAAIHHEPPWRLVANVRPASA